MADSGPRESNTKATIVLQFQVQKARVSGQRSDGTVYLRETYQIVADVGLGRRKADRVAAMLNRLRIPVARRELSQRLASQEVAAAAPDQAEGPQPMPERTRARIEQLASDEARWAEIDHLLQCPLRYGDPCDYKGHKAGQLWDPSYRQIL